MAEENDPKKPVQIQIQVQIDDDVAMGRYVNMARIFHNQTEFVLDAMFLQPQTKTAKVLSRLVLSPVNAKYLHAALAQNIGAYEKKFGPISGASGGSSPGPILH